MDLVEHLVKRLGVTTRQAVGGAGLILGLAQERMDRGEFERLADSIPAVSDLIGKAPQVDQPMRSAMLQAVSRWFGGLGGLGHLVGSFEKLACEKSMVSQFAEAVVEFFREHTSEKVAARLQEALR